jgi:biotin carboxyl carrier protein
MKMFRVVVNGSEYKAAIEELMEESAFHLSLANTASAPIQTPRQPAATAQLKPAAAKTIPAAGGGAIVAPMPGTILRVAVNIGDKVAKGHTLLVLEAMKMENEIMAPADGVVQELNVTKGVSVNAGEILVVLAS